ncbi:hypothetical protein C8J32_11136 [Rhizobium sp. PP-CC-3A-592]|nr:hypothetical protein C8J32_11136 [Rhizobium sp. PP-CC-3A-592]
MLRIGSSSAAWKVSACLAMLAFCMTAVERSSAQTIEGLSIGEPLAAENGTKVAGPISVAARSLGAMEKGVKLSATVLPGSHEILRLDVKWQERPVGVPAYFADFKFGVTTLSAISSRFGSKGLLNAKVPPVQANQGYLSFVSSYEVKNSKLIVSFTTRVDKAALAYFRNIQANDLYDQVADVAVLTSISLANRDEFAERAGPAVADVGYKPIEWVASSADAVPKRIPNLSRVKLSQLPVARIYTGPNNAPDLTGRASIFQTFASRLSERMADGPDYAGEYAIVRVPCGRDCVDVFAGNVRTGEVFRFPLAAQRVPALKLQFSLKSRMMVTQWRETVSQACVVQIFDFENDEWIELFKHTIGSSSLCAKSLKANLQP